jgi:hypothetical protein
MATTSALLMTSAIAANVTASPTASTVKINKAIVAFEAYNISGNNYFKLRDVAMALMQTEKRFSVYYDSTKNKIEITMSESYIPVGGELSISGKQTAVQAAATSSDVFLRGKKINLTAYNIGGNNYFKLRDIAAAINFSVIYDSKTNTVVIDTTREYFFNEIRNILPSATEATEKVYYNDTDTGNITITRVDNSYYSIEAFNISSDKDYATLQKIIGVFTTDPQTVLEASKKSSIEGRKDLQIDGKDIACITNGQTKTIDIRW